MQPESGFQTEFKRYRTLLLVALVDTARVSYEKEVTGQSYLEVNIDTNLISIMHTAIVAQ
jgi:hypothetical protein